MGEIPYVSCDKGTNFYKTAKHKGEIILSVAKALQRRGIRVSETFAES